MPLRGVRFLARRRGLWRFAVLPVLVNGLLLLVFVTLGLLLVDDVYRWLQPAVVDSLRQGEGFWGSLGKVGAGALAALAAAVAGLVTAAAGLGSTLLMAAVLAGPFHEKLAEETERVVGGEPPDDGPWSLAALRTDTARALTSALRRLALFSIFYVPLFLLSMIPVIGVLGLLGTSVYSSYFLTLNFLDPTLDRRHLTLGQKLRWSRRHLAAWMGFGATCFGLALIPVVNLAISPALVVAGVLFWTDRESQSVLAASTEAPSGT